MLFFLRLLVTALTVAFVLHYVLGERGNLQGDWAWDWKWLAGAAFLVLPVVLGRGWKWAILIRPLEPSVTLRQATASYLGCLPLGIITPGRVGEFSRCFFLPQASVRGWAGAGRVLLDNWTDFLAVLPWCLLGLGFLGGWPWALGGMALAAIFFPVRLWLRILRRFAKKLPDLWGLRAVLGQTLPLPEQSGRETALAFLAGAAIYGVEWVQLDFLIRFLGSSSPGLLTLGGLAALVALANSVQVTLAGLGVREGLSVYLFSMAGVTPQAALAAAFVLFALNQILPALLGLAFKPVGLYAHTTA
jgi:uncharacterized membrane protein YbhN (UPF0104 family)